MLVELKSLSQHGGNWGYFVNSNEGGIKASAEVLKKVRFAGKGVHLGVSGWHNYDISVITKPEFIIIMDESLDVKEFHEHTINLLKKATNREEFIAQIAKKLLLCPLCPDGDERKDSVEHFSQHAKIYQYDEKDKPIYAKELWTQILESPEGFVLSALRCEMARKES